MKKPFLQGEGQVPDKGEFDRRIEAIGIEDLATIIYTSGGKNISPSNIEHALAASSFIEQAVVIGDNRKYLSALIVSTFASLEAWAAENGLAFASRAELIKKQEVLDLFAKEIGENMKDYARVGQIGKFTLLESEWSQITGELTPTLKMKHS